MNGNDGAGMVPPVVPVGGDDEDEDDTPERPVAGESPEDREARRKRNRESRRRYDPQPSPNNEGDGGGTGGPGPAGLVPPLGELPVFGDPDPSGSGSGSDEDRRTPAGRRLGDLTTEEIGAELNATIQNRWPAPLRRHDRRRRERRAAKLEAEARKLGL